MKFTTSILAIAFIAVPALAASYDDYEQYERSLSDVDVDVYERAFDATDDVVVTREDLDELFGREFVADIEERSPFGLGLLFKGIKAAVKIGKAAHHAHEAKKNHHNRREFIEDEDLELREFEEDDLLERENFDDLD
ncbi:hypothetical protein CPC08DRAFT_754160 [Agrocybe pediades]|nr:hypothetical protein CPC08DRAFT_754160 [Agrocybe pediades]